MKFIFRLMFKFVFNVCKLSILFGLFVTIPYIYKHMFLFQYVKHNSFRIVDGLGHGGTAFNYKYKDQVVTVTNFHVCKFNKEMLVLKNNWPTAIKVLKVDIVNDICILEAVNTFLPLMNYTNAYHDMPIFSRGFMDGTDRHIIEGYINSEQRQLMNPFTIRNKVQKDLCDSEYGTESRFYPHMNRWECVSVIPIVRTSLMILPGQSGSAVMDYTGSVLGVVAIYDLNTRFASYIPIQKVNDLIERMNNEQKFK